MSYKRLGKLVSVSRLSKICLCTVSCATLCSERCSLQSHLLIALQDVIITLVSGLHAGSEERFQTSRVADFFSLLPGF